MTGKKRGCCQYYFKRMNQIIESQYFGCIAFFIELYKCDHIYLEQHETFQKMSFRNRCQILGAGKVINLSVPVLGGRDQKTFTNNIYIDNTQKWQVQHWRTLESCYNKSAFFLHYGPEIKDILFANHDKLWDLNRAALKWVIKKLKWDGTISASTNYEKNLRENWLDNRNQFTPSSRLDYKTTPYQQVFTVPFESNLSILDLLFNLGSQSSAYLKSQIQNG